jgi:signal transduction histidine kinase
MKATERSVRLRSERPRGVRLRTGFLLVVLLGVIAPLGVVGLWLARSTQRSAEALVRARQEATLAEIVPLVARSWAGHRTDLLRIAEGVAVQTALHGRGQLLPADAPTVTPTELNRQWARLDGVVDRIELRDAAGISRGVLDRSAQVGYELSPALHAPIPVSVAVHDVSDGRRIGTLSAWVRAGALLPSDLLLPGLGGSVLALFEPAGGTSLLPLPMDPSLFESRRFDWADDQWVVARQRLYEPPLVLALAGPVGPVAGPLAEATEQGTLALLLVTLLALALTVLVGRWFSGPLRRLVDAADGVAAGELQRNVPEAGPEEVHRVARAFNTMTASLRGTLEQLSQQEALAAMGELAASLAHEVRNPLTAIRLDLERADERLDEGDPAAALVQRALRDIERLDASVNNTLRLARTGRLKLGPVELAEPLHQAVAAAAPRFRERRAVLEVPPEAGRGVRVRADAAALEQLFLNLLLNAADALGAAGRAGIEVDAGEVARIVVWDRGPGMSPTTLARVFEPFFSTKSEGTGLGLPIAQRIALSHSGDMAIESEPGRGTIVTVRLPLVRNGPAVGTGTERSDRASPTLTESGVNHGPSSG